MPRTSYLPPSRLLSSPPSPSSSSEASSPSPSFSSPSPSSLPPPKKLRSGNLVARPQNGFFLYRSQHQEVLRKVEKDQRIISRTIGHMWKNLSEEERKEWNALAKKLKEEHKSLNPDYHFKPRPRKKPIIRRNVKRNGVEDLERCKQMANILLSGKDGQDLHAAVEALGPLPSSKSLESNATIESPPSKPKRKTRPRTSKSKPEGIIVPPSGSVGPPLLLTFPSEWSGDVDFKEDEEEESTSSPPITPHLLLPDNRMTSPTSPLLIPNVASTFLFKAQRQLNPASTIIHTPVASPRTLPPMHTTLAMATSDSTTVIPLEPIPTLMYPPFQQPQTPPRTNMELYSASAYRCSPLAGMNSTYYPDIDQGQGTYAVQNSSSFIVRQTPPPHQVPIGSDYYSSPPPSDVLHPFSSASTNPGGGAWASIPPPQVLQHHQVQQQVHYGIMQNHQQNHSLYGIGTEQPHHSYGYPSAPLSPRNVTSSEALL